MKHGLTWLSSKSWIYWIGDAFEVDDAAFDDMLAFMRTNVARSPNPRNPSTYLKRIQCTFVTPGTAAYEFGQHNDTIRVEIDKWPVAVQRALRTVQRFAPHFGLDANVYNGVHSNLYSDGSVGVAPHSDKEHSMCVGFPIFSFTMLSDPSLPRNFSVYNLDGTKRLEVPLGHGDVLIMGGDMQKGARAE